MRVGPLMNGIGALVRRARRELASSLSALYHVGKQEESCLQARKTTLARQWICRQLDLGLPVSRNMRNTCLLFMPLSPWCCYSSLNWPTQLLLIPCILPVCDIIVLNISFAHVEDPSQTTPYFLP